MAKQKEPREIILEFLDSLPETMRYVVFSGIALAFRTGPIPSEWNYKQDVLDYLHPNNENERAMRAILVCACVDHILTRNRKFDYQSYIDAMDETGSTFLMAKAREKPLQDKHFEISARRWIQLRDGRLSLRSLQEFERRTWDWTPWTP